MAIEFRCRNGGHDVIPCINCGQFSGAECIACRDAEIARLTAELADARRCRCDNKCALCRAEIAALKKKGG